MTSKSVDRLIGKLNSEGIAYCHWKSNFSLAKGLAGETDLDLLVDRRSLPNAISILRSLHYKPAAVKWGPRIPGISHYYDYDPQVAQLIHIHLFSRVQTGESFVKSHLFPFEPMILENTRYIDQIKVTSKPAELVLFILRMFIKYGSPLDLVYLYRKSENIKEELRWLQNGSELSEALRLLRQYCPVIDEHLFIRCIDTLGTNSSLIYRVNLARQVRRCLSIYARQTNFNRILAYIQLLWGQLRRRSHGTMKNKVPCAGGVVIAFVGPDATGKSTLISECGHWLAEVFAVRIVHAGKPPSTLLTIPIDIVVPLARSLLPQLRPSRVERYGSPANSNTSKPKARRLFSLIYAVRAVTLGWKRRQLLVKARRAAANGDIVLCDRYPSEIVGMVDSRRLQENPNSGGVSGVIYNWLARLEEQLYRQIPPPDIVLRLRVSVETAKKRNRERIKEGKGADADVEFRHSLNQDWYMTGVKNLYDIDAERPLNETICHVKRIVWESF